MKRNNNKGFTLAELLIVVAIIAVLVAVAIPTFSSQIERSRQSTDLANLRSAYAAASLAVLTKDDYNSDSFLAGRTGNITTWFDGNTFVEVTAEAANHANPPMKGQATQKSAIVNLSGLSKKINYQQSVWGLDGTVPKSTATEHIGTTEKGIFVAFTYNTATGGYDFGEIGYIMDADNVGSIVDDDVEEDITLATSGATTVSQSITDALIDGVAASDCTFGTPSIVSDTSGKFTLDGTTPITDAGVLQGSIAEGAVTDKVITVSVPVELQTPVLGKVAGTITVVLTTKTT